MHYLHFILFQKNYLLYYIVIKLCACYNSLYKLHKTGGFS